MQLVTQVLMTCSGVIIWTCFVEGLMDPDREATSLPIRREARERHARSLVPIPGLSSLPFPIPFPIQIPGITGGLGGSQAGSISQASSFSGVPAAPSTAGSFASAQATSQAGHGPFEQQFGGPIGGTGGGLLGSQAISQVFGGPGFLPGSGGGAFSQSFATSGSGFGIGNSQAAGGAVPGAGYPVVQSSAQSIAGSGAQLTTSSAEASSQSLSGSAFQQAGPLSQPLGTGLQGAQTIPVTPSQAYGNPINHEVTNLGESSYSKPVANQNFGASHLPGMLQQQGAPCQPTCPTPEIVTAGESTDIAGSDGYLETTTSLGVTTMPASTQETAGDIIFPEIRLRTFIASEVVK